MVLIYDPLAPFAATAMRYFHTVLPHILGKKDIWFYIFIHFLVKALYLNGCLPGADVSKSTLFLDWNYIGIITALTTFFEVFYTMSSFSRYLHMYDVTGKMLDNVCGFSFLCSLYLRETSPQHMRLCTRFLMTSVILFFWGLRGGETEDMWSDLIRRGLVKPKEMDFLKSITDPMQRSIIMLHLTAKVMAKSEEVLTDKVIFKHMLGKLRNVRKDKQEIVDTLFLQLPFQYFHILNIMVQMNLLVWAYGMAITDSIIGPIVYFFATLIFMGLMELANQLADPYGEDETDFPIDAWMTQMLIRNVMVVERDQPHEGVLNSTIGTKAAIEGDSEGASPTGGGSLALAPLLPVGSAANGANGDRRASRRELWMSWGEMEHASLSAEGPLPAKEAEYVIYNRNREDGYSALTQHAARVEVAKDESEDEDMDDDDD